MSTAIDTTSQTIVIADDLVVGRIGHRLTGPHVWGEHSRSPPTPEP